MILIFDLDGTLSDPSKGITASLNYALKNLDLPAQPESALTKYIGPSLVDIFSDLLETTDDTVIQPAISLFRKRYGSIGYKENILYPNMKSILKTLSSTRHTLYIATTKKQDIAKAVTDFFEISGYFKAVLGCGSTRKKVELIEEIKEKENCTDAAHEMIMIGDRYIDMAAGKQTGCFCAGVLWGFGSKQELVDSGADLLINHPEDLLDLSN